MTDFMGMRGFALLPALCFAGVGAAILGTAMPAQAAPDSVICFQGGTVYLEDGPAAETVVVISGDEVIQVGGELPSGCDVVDLSGLVLTPGLIATHTGVGLVEVGLEAYTVDGEVVEKVEISPSFKVSDAYNPRSTLIPVIRTTGITSALTSPVGGLISGQSAWVDLDGSSQADTVIVDSTAMHARLRGGEKSRASSLHQIREALDDARAYSRSKSQYDSNRSRSYSLGRADLEALLPVLDGDIPLVIRGEQASEIEALLRLAKAQKIRMVITGGSEAHLLAEELAEANIAVIVNPLVYGPGTFSQIHAREDNAAILQKAGVDVIIGGAGEQDTHRTGTLRLVAGNAVRGGMEHDSALRAITQTPAEVFGLRDKGYGVIETGARANLVVWSADPLEVTTSVKAVYIGGVSVGLTTRHTQLMERYRSLPGTPFAPLDLP